MREQLDKLDNEICWLDAKIAGSPLLDIATSIATVSIHNFTDELLRKGLAITAAIAEFDAELNRPK